MGKQENKQCEENTLIDFLYKDTDLINSFYSQLFGGNTTLIKKTEEYSNELSGSIEGNGIIIKGDVNGKKSDTKDLATTINPHDYKIIELLQNMNLKKTIPDEISNGTIVTIEGSLLFRNYDILSKILPFIGKNNLVKEFNNPINPASKGKEKNITIGKVLTQFVELMPYGLEFEIFTENNKSFLCIVKEQNLTITPNDILRAYTNYFDGKWTVVGIIDKPMLNRKKSISEMRGLFDQASEVFSQMMSDKLTYIIRPIVIYRKLTI